MSDFADSSSELSDLHLSLSLNQHATRCRIVELPICEWCEEGDVEILPNGAKSRYCSAQCSKEASE